MSNALSTARVAVIDDLIRVARMTGRRAKDPLQRIATGEVEMLLARAREQAEAGEEIMPAEEAALTSI